MKHASNEGKGFEGQISHNDSLKVRPNKVDDSNHHDTNQKIAFDGLKGHLLIEAFELVFSLGYFFLMIFVLSLYDVGIF